MILLYRISAGTREREREGKSERATDLRFPGRIRERGKYVVSFTCIHIYADVNTRRKHAVGVRTEIDRSSRLVPADIAYVTYLTRDCKLR